MIILAIDPGPKQSAFIVFEADQDIPCIDFGILSNDALLERLHAARVCFFSCGHLAIEMVACYGMPVGREIFETALWTGRFIQAFGGPFTLVYRKDVKLHLCGSVRAKDSNIRQALIDRFGPPGTKKARGKLYGISKDLWAALAVAVTYSDGV